MAERCGMVIEAQQMRQSGVGRRARTVSIIPILPVAADIPTGSRGSSAHCLGARVVAGRGEHLAEVEADGPEDVAFCEVRLVEDRLAACDALGRLLDRAPFPVGDGEIAQDRQVRKIVARGEQSLPQPVGADLVVRRRRQEPNERTIVEEDMPVADLVPKFPVGRIDKLNRLLRLAGSGEEAACRQGRVRRSFGKAKVPEPRDTLERRLRARRIVLDLREEPIGMPYDRAPDSRAAFDDRVQRRPTFTPPTGIERVSGQDHIGRKMEVAKAGIAEDLIGHRRRCVVVPAFSVGERQDELLDRLSFWKFEHQPNGIAEIVQFVCKKAGPIDDAFAFGRQQAGRRSDGVNRYIYVGSLIIGAGDMTVDFVDQPQEQADIASAHTKNKEATDDSRKRGDREFASFKHLPVKIAQCFFRQRHKPNDAGIVARCGRYAVVNDADLITMDGDQIVRLRKRFEVVRKACLRRLYAPRDRSGKQDASRNRLAMCDDYREHPTQSRRQLADMCRDFGGKACCGAFALGRRQQVLADTDPVFQLVEATKVAVPFAEKIGIQVDSSCAHASEYNVQMRPIQREKLEQLRVFQRRQLALNKLLVIALESFFVSRVLEDQMLILATAVQLQQKTQAVVIYMLRLAHDKQRRPEVANVLEIFAANNDRLACVARKERAFGEPSHSEKTFGVLDSERVTQLQPRKASEFSQEVLPPQRLPALRRKVVFQRAVGAISPRRRNRQFGSTALYEIAVVDSGLPGFGANKWIDNGCQESVGRDAHERAIARAHNDKADSEQPHLQRRDPLFLSHQRADIPNQSDSGCPDCHQDSTPASFP